MNPSRIKHVSKFLSRHLRHPSTLVRPDEGGWVPIADILAASPGMTREAIEEAVRENDKQRFTIDGDRIRANQGHTIPVDLDLERAIPPEYLYHGTYHEAVPAIEREGLLKMKRHHVHLAAETGTAVIVGKRSGTPVVFRVRAREMSRVGYQFFKSVNGVWLVERVPPDYLEKLPMKRTGRGGGNEQPGKPPTPKCDSCRTTMVPASATEWKCPNPNCEMHNQPVSTGVYPT